MRYLAFLASVFPFITDKARAADEAIANGIDSANLNAGDALAAVNTARAEVGAELAAQGARIAALEALAAQFGAPTGPSEPPAEAPAPEAPPAGEPTTMAPTPAGMTWWVIPEDAGPQAGEAPGLRCSSYTPVPATVPAGHVLVLLPVGVTPGASSST